MGLTWYSLTDQIDWDSAMRQARGKVNSFGLYDLQRKIRPVGEAYRTVIADWKPKFDEFDLTAYSLWPNAR